MIGEREDRENIVISDDGHMNTRAKYAVRDGIKALAIAVSRTAHAHGWWGDGLTRVNGVDIAGIPGEPTRNFGELIALMHSELSEALEAWRDGDDITTIAYADADGALIDQHFIERGMRTEGAKPVGVASEFADVIIRILDTCCTLNIPITDALIAKAEYNISRPYRHGGKLA